MTDANTSLSKQLLLLDQQLEYELRAFSDNVSALDGALERKQYDRFIGHLSYIQELLSDAEQLTHSLALDRSDPDFFVLLKTTDRIREHSVTFGRLRGSFYQTYRMQEEQDKDLERELTPEEVPTDLEEHSDERTSDLSSDEEFLQQQEALAEQAALAAEAEAEALAKKKEKRQKEQRLQEERLRRQRKEALKAEDDARQKEAQLSYWQQIDDEEALLARQKERSSDPAFAQDVSDELAPAVHPAQPREHTDFSTVVPSAPEGPPSKHIPLSAHEQPPAPVPNKSGTASREAGDYDASAIQRDRWEEANRLGMRQDMQKQISEAELYQERMRQQEEERLAQEAIDARHAHNEAVQDRYRERQQAAEQHVRLEKGHVDFSHDLYDTPPEPGQTEPVPAPEPERLSTADTSAPERPADVNRVKTAPSYSQEEGRTSSFIPERDAGHPSYDSGHMQPEHSQNWHDKKEVHQAQADPHHESVVPPLSPKPEQLEQNAQSADNKPTANAQAHAPSSEAPNPSPHSHSADHSHSAGHMHPEEHIPSAHQEPPAQSFPEESARPLQKPNYRAENPAQAPTPEPRTEQEPFREPLREPFREPSREQSHADPYRPSSAAHRQSQDPMPMPQSQPSAASVNVPPLSHKEEQKTSSVSTGTRDASDPGHPQSPGQKSAPTTYTAHTEQHRQESQPAKEHGIKTPEREWLHPAHTQGPLYTPETHGAKQRIPVTHAAKPGASAPLPEKQQTVKPSDSAPKIDAESLQNPTFYRYTPFGVQQDTRLEQVNQPSRSNSQIYSKIKHSMEQKGSDTPLTISSTYLSSMAWNVHMARVDYQGKKDTPEAVSAAYAYQRQRQALESLKADIRAGRIQLEQPEVQAPKDNAPAARKAGETASPYRTQYSYTPDGVTGINLDHNGQITSTVRLRNKAVRDNFRYTQEQPLKVSPQYEKAMQDRLQKATSALDTALKLPEKTPPKISQSLHDELRLSQDAFAAYQKAKQAGVVVVSKDSTVDKPDFKSWQQRQQANIFGTTVNYKGSDPTLAKKGEVKSQGASVLSNKSKLRQDRFYNYYARALGHKSSVYAWNASNMLSRNLYMVLQMGEDNAVRTFESGRYYAVTAAQLTDAVLHLHVIAPKRFNRQSSARELHQFAQYLGKSNRVLSGDIISKTQQAREGKKVILSLKSQQDALQKRIDSFGKPELVLRKEDQQLLSRLKQEHQKVTQKLIGAQQRQASLNHDLRQEHALLKLRRKNAEESRILSQLRKDHGPFITRGMLQRDIENTRALGQKTLLAKFGKNLTVYSDKSVKQEIKLLRKKTAELKSRIKALQSKGSALSQAQRKALKDLMDEHKSMSLKLRKLIGLDHARGTINAELELKNNLLMRMNKNANAFHSSLFALKHFALRALRESAESGVQGFGAGINVMTNRYVHRMIKKVFKVTLRYGTGSALVLMTGDIHAASAFVTYAERAKMMAKVKTRTVVKRARKKATELAAEGTKKAVSAITPKPLREGVQYTSKLLRGKFRTITTLKQKLSQKFWASKLGHGLSSASNFSRNVMELGKAALKVGKSIAIKLVAGFLFLFLLCGLIASLAGAPAGGAAGGLILSPYEGAEGKIDLSPYVIILNECQTKYDEKIENTRQAYLSQYDKVTIVPAIPDNNMREILSMMAVRCSQDLDLSNAMVERYLKSIFEDSHFYTTQESDFYSCSGCKTRTVRTGHTSECPDACTVIHTEQEEYCPGTHQDLTLTQHVLFFDEIFTADSMGNEGQTAVAGQELGTFKITHYCACYECCGKYPGDADYGITATGTTATAGRTIAVDPNVIPLGSHVIIDGKEYVAEDVGGAIDGNRIDIYVSSHAEALALGVKNLPVYYASYEGESVIDTGTWDGWTEDNVFWCKTIYGMDWSELYTGIPNVTDVMGNETNLDGVTFIDGDRSGFHAIVDIAMSQLGQTGGQPYWSWYGFDSRVEWCATFVSWCANQNGVLGTSVPKFASCRAEGVPWFQDHGQWANAEDIVPVAGDIIFFDWEGDGVPNHVGIVIGTDGDKVYTVEGNSGDAVKTKSYNLNSKLIFGYGLPNY